VEPGCLYFLFPLPKKSPKIEENFLLFFCAEINSKNGYFSKIKNESVFYKIFCFKNKTFCCTFVRRPKHWEQSHFFTLYLLHFPP